MIVGTSLKVDGITWNPVDPSRARYFVHNAREVRENVRPMPRA
jgi:predicted TIM-barrel enzyme